MRLLEQKAEPDLRSIADRPCDCSKNGKATQDDEDDSDAEFLSEAAWLALEKGDGKTALTKSGKAVVRGPDMAHTWAAHATAGLVERDYELARSYSSNPYSETPKAQTYGA